MKNTTSEIHAAVPTLTVPMITSEQIDESYLNSYNETYKRLEKSYPLSNSKLKSCAKELDLLDMCKDNFGIQLAYGNCLPELRDLRRCTDRVLDTFVNSPETK